MREMGGHDDTNKFITPRNEKALLEHLEQYQEFSPSMKTRWAEAFLQFLKMPNK